MKSTIQPAEQDQILLFGGHIGAQTKQSLGKLVQALAQGPNADWIKETVAGLPSYWDALTNKIPDIAGTVSGKPLLADLNSWVQSGSSDDTDDDNLAGVVVGPLLVAIQLDQYWRYLQYQSAQKGSSGNDPQAELVAGQAGAKVEVLGFCVGLLGSLAVASSSNRQEFIKYGAAAMRMAMFIGALTDACEVWNKGIGKGKSVSYAIAWRDAKQHADLTSIISALFPEAYISVLFDKLRATVTTSERTAPSLVRQMRAAGLTVAEINIEGQIHAPGPDRKRHTQAIVELCRENPDLQFAEASRLALPTYDNQGDGIPISKDRGDITEMVLNAVLMLQCNWYGTFSNVVAQQSEANIMAFGLDRCIPPSLMRRLGTRQQHFEDIEKNIPLLSQTQVTSQQPQQQQQRSQAPAAPQPAARPSAATSGSSIPSDANQDLDLDSIVVVGAAVKTAGADDLDEFVDMLKSGKSQHELITRERLQHEIMYRGDAGSTGRKYFANFVKDGDAFDHKFFKRSPRESQAIDPQSRLCLEGAYQAVEQSGYFTETTVSDAARDKLNVGVFVGNAGVDYDYNISSNPATPFTATGGLRSFIVGRLSHYFGWTGPAVTFDTACSSSAVALHHGVRSLAAGECTAALCGGVNVITNMIWMQNLTAGSFLSATGQCKPFDDDADGYCRAEGMGFVFLKKLRDALADGNPILATIPATLVYQNLNITPLFVPNSPSLSTLFRDIVKQAKLEARNISLVEAHGTGTAVGDPAEYESIRLALGGPIREKALPVGSVKGHVGHTEGASGLIALVKVIMMMRQGFIPSQASFKKLNHLIEARPDDMMEIVTTLRPWADERKIALINNYGACGSNASMIVGEAPNVDKTKTATKEASRFPFWITGFDAKSVARYSAKLNSWMQLHPEATLGDMSFNMNRQSNRALPQGIVFSSDSLSDLKTRLQQLSSAGKENAEALGIVTPKPMPPVILCFGGQVSTFVGLDRDLHDSVNVLRFHLGECDAAIKAAGLGSIYPDIFSQEPIQDTVKLQTMLFAMQYSCAKTWMDCGLQGKVSAVVGHSFGEITALCVSGVLSLADTVKLVAGRARLVRDAWGPDSGAMMAVEADRSLVEALVREANHDGSAAIACHNGPRSFTVAGSTSAIDKAAAIIAQDSRFSGVNSKRLNVTNAFHSGLVEKLVDGLGEVGKGLTFNEPTIPMEHATEGRMTSPLDWRFVPAHMRNPVFFDQAVHRLSAQYPQAIFLEAGSASTITVMASRALAQASGSHHFQAMAITNTKNKSALDNLTDATVALWKQGLPVAFWQHHAKQAREWAELLLPPYQFDRSGRHWLQMGCPSVEIAKAAEELIKTRGLTMATAGQQQLEGQDPAHLPMYIFEAYQDKTKKKPRFRVNTLSEKYIALFNGHIIAQTAPICPATLQSEVAIEALFSLNPEWKKNGWSPVVRDLFNSSPVCADPAKAVYIDFEATDDSMVKWNMKMFSINATTGKDKQVHAEARMHFRAPTDPAYIQEFEQFERLVTHSRCKTLLQLSLDDDQDDIDVLRGPNVYRAFKEVVDYPDLYRGVRSVVGRGSESAGIVSKRHQGENWLDAALSDSFNQVGGIWVNLMTDVPSGEMYIASGSDVSMRSPKADTGAKGREHGPSLWHVLAQHTRKNDKEFTTDVFVFDAATGALCEAMLGIHYSRVPKASMSKMLTHMTKDPSVLRTNAAVASAPAAKSAAAAPAKAPAKAAAPASSPKPKQKKVKAPKAPKASKKKDIAEEVRQLVANVAGIEPDEFTLDTEMADLGIDSLMGMELAREVDLVFKCTIDQTEQMEATTLRKFVDCVQNALDREGGGAPEEDDESEEEEEDLSSDEDDADTDISTPDETQCPTPAEETTGLVLNTSGQSGGHVLSNLSLSHADVLEAFGEVKMLTDELLKEHHPESIYKAELAGNNRLCVAIVVEAMEQLGMPLRAATAGTSLERVPYDSQHQRLMECIYIFLRDDARLINEDPVTGKLTRSHIAVPRKTSREVLQELIHGGHKGFSVCNQITYFAGQKLGDVLSGKTDGVRVIFGSAEGRELVQNMYRDYPFNQLNYMQMRQVIGRLADRVRNTQPGQVLKVLEMGAGTGGTTVVMAPFLASLNMPVEYTFTDLSPSMVANARRRFGKQYPFMKFAVHDIEQPPSEDYKGQHIVLASNAVHATRNLVVSARNIRETLRPDGFVMILEMTRVVPFLDLVFGLLEGWWLFDDGRHHAITPAEHWERELHAAGFGHVDWTDGELPENTFQKVIIACASGQQGPRLPRSPPGSAAATGVVEFDRGDVKAREAEAENLVSKYTGGWVNPELNAAGAQKVAAVPSNGSVVVVTGATGSLGSHLVQRLAEDPKVSVVYCVNRITTVPVAEKQAKAFSSRGIELSPAASAKLRVAEADTSKPQLGLPPQEYKWLAENGTHIIHNAWPMSGTRGLKAFEPQLQSMRNLLDLARSMATRENNRVRIGFQFVSSIGVVGYSGKQRVLEQRVPMEAVMPGGYTEAKWTCERMLDETLHRYPQLFRPMVVRPGQIAGSTKSGFWNPIEHFAAVVKSAQSLQLWPDFDGTMMWLPVDSCAGSIADLLKIGDASAPEAYPVYHIDNPVGQPWKQMSPVLAGALGIPADRIIPFAQWIDIARRSPLPTETDHPATRVLDFLEVHFRRMSCGGLILDTTLTKEHSETMAKEGPVSAEVAQRYVASWKKMGVLHP